MKRSSGAFFWNATGSTNKPSGSFPWGATNGYGRISLAAIQALPALRALYLPGVAASLYQKSDGSVGPPTTESPTNKIGVLGDMKSSMTIGQELLLNGDFSAGSSGWTTSGTVDFSNGRCTLTNNNALISQSGLCAAGVFYWFAGDVISSTYTGLYVLTAPVYTSLGKSIGSERKLIRATTTSFSAIAGGGAGYTGSIIIDNLSLKACAGLHAIQPSDSARAVYGLSGSVPTIFFPTGTLMSTYIALTGGYVLVAVPGVGPVWSDVITTAALDLTPALIGAAGAAGIAVLSSMPDDATKALIEAAFRKLAFTGVI